MKNELIRTINKVSQFIADHQADISLAVGAVAGVMTVISASKQTLNMPDILDEAKAEIEEVKELAATNTEVNKGKELTKVYLKTTLKTVKNYIPTALWGGATVGLVGNSFRVLKKENNSLRTQIKTIAAVANEAYQRTKEKYGEEEAMRLWTGAKEKTATIISTDDNGKETKKKEKVNMLDKDHLPDSNSPFYILFDEANCPYTFDSKYKGTNVIFVKNALRECNDILKLKGRIYVNEIRQKFKCREIDEGWEWGITRKNNSDAVLDFGLLDFYDGDSYLAKQSFMKGDITGILLRLNVEYIRGNIDYDYEF